MAEECAHECSSCGESGCSDRTAQGPSTIETNSRSNIKHVIGVVSGKGGVGKSLEERGHPRRRRHRTVHPEDLRHHEPADRRRRRHPARPDAKRHQGDVHQPHAAERRHPGGLARPGRLERHPSVLQRDELGRDRLPVRRHASGNLRRAAHRVPVRRSWWL